jgi:hypothetical protein
MSQSQEIKPGLALKVIYSLLFFFCVGVLESVRIAVSAVISVLGCLPSITRPLAKL